MTSQASQISLSEAREQRDSKVRELTETPHDFVSHYCLRPQLLNIYYNYAHSHKELARDYIKLHDSQYKLSAWANVNFFKWSFNELLEFYSSSDVPANQKGYALWFSTFLKAAPSYGGEGQQLYRGTSLETLQEFGFGDVWSTDKETALKFSKLCCSIWYRLFGAKDRTPILLKYTFEARDIVYSHVNGRGESEVFVNPKKIINPVITHVGGIKL